MYKLSLSHLDGSIARASGKPVIARINGDASDPAKMTANHSHQLPRRVPCWLGRLQRSTRYKLLSTTTDNKSLCMFGRITKRVN